MPNFTIPDYKYYNENCNTNIPDKGEYSRKWYIYHLTNVEYFGIWSFDGTIFLKATNELSNPKHEIGYIFRLELHAHACYNFKDIFTNLKWYIDVRHRWKSNFNTTSAIVDIPDGFDHPLVSLSKDIPIILNGLIKSDKNILDIQLH